MKKLKTIFITNFKTKVGVPVLQNYAIIMAKILPAVVCKKSSDESICFITHLFCIYKWQAIGRLRGGVETEFTHVHFSLALAIKETIRSFLPVLFLFCCRNFDSD